MPKKKTDLDLAIEIEEGNYLHAKGCGYTERARQRKRIAGWLKELKAKRKEIKAYQTNIRLATNTLLTCNKELIRLEVAISQLKDNTRGWGTIAQW